MKQILVVIIILISCSNTFSQSFAPVGTTWYYGVAYAWSNDVGYKIVRAEKDTTVKNKKCTLIKDRPYCGMYGMFSDRNTYVFQEDSIVYFLTSDFDDFQILYNYKARKGQKWTLKFKNGEWMDSIVVEIRSVYTTIINDRKLIKQNVSYSYSRNNFQINAEVVEIIGDLGYLFNFYHADIVCDGDYSTGLRCYQDTFIGKYNVSEYSCDYTKVSVKDIIINDVVISPNPCEDYFVINNVPEAFHKYHMYNSFGSLLSTGDIKATTIVDMSRFSPGLYFVKIFKPNGSSQTLKLIKSTVKIAGTAR